jgi:hypothetical protein
MSETDERWTSDTKRCDGLELVVSIDGYVIMPHDESLPIDRCPCCDKPFRTTRAAQLVADMLLPMTRSR